MIDATTLYLARAVLGLQAIALIWVGAKIYDENPRDPNDMPQRWTELRAKHVLPVAGCFLTGALIVLFAAAALPR